MKNSQTGVVLMLIVIAMILAGIFEYVKRIASVIS